jgi:hypothetical protein
MRLYVILSILCQTIISLIIKCDRHNAIIEVLPCNDRIDCFNEGLLSYRPEILFIEVYNNATLLIFDKDYRYVSPIFPEIAADSSQVYPFHAYISKILCDLEQKRISSYDKRLQVMEKIRTLDDYSIFKDHPNDNISVLLLIATITACIILVLNLYILMK